MSERTLTTQQVEDGFAHEPEYEYHDPINYGAHVASNRRAFKRWLAEYTAEVERAAAEKALTKAADDLRVNFSRGAAIAMHHECHKKQCRCGNPGNDEIVREVFEAAREAIRNEALAYRLNEGEKQ